MQISTIPAFLLALLLSAKTSHAVDVSNVDVDFSMNKLFIDADGADVLTGNRNLVDVGGQECPFDRRLQVRSGCRVGSGAIITNGLIKLGVNEGGELNTRGGIDDDLGRTSVVGLRYIIEPGREAESTAYGCDCEGWGAKVTGASTDYGWANQASGCAIGSYVSFTSTANSAISVVKLPGDKLEVTHNFYPSRDTDNAYEVEVTLRNLDNTTKLTDVRYRRSMDWDIWPTVRNAESFVAFSSKKFHLKF